MNRNRLLAAALVIIAAGAVEMPSARADPYRWCALYNAKGGTNCGFVTFEQCMATVSGIGGFCNPNPFYNGVPFDGGNALLIHKRRHRIRH
jgi:hypothetical protein